MSKIGRKISIYINEPWNFQAETKISVIEGRVENELGKNMLIALSKPVTYQSTSFDRIVATILKVEKPANFLKKPKTILQIAPVISTTQLQDEELKENNFEWGSDFHKAASWRAWFLEGITPPP